MNGRSEPRRFVSPQRGPALIRAEPATVLVAQARLPLPAHPRALGAPRPGLRRPAPGVQSYRQMALIVRAQRVRKRLAGMLAVATIVVVVSAGPAARAERATGAALLKVEFIERFTRFIEWPRDVLGDGQPRFIVC